VHADEDEQPMSDLGRQVATNVHGSTRDPLDECPH
jgi:hypothetical protein